VYTIFINDKPFIITDDWDYLINDKSYQHHYNDDLDSVLKISADFLNNTRDKGVVIHASNAIKAFETFCSSYDVVEAAGGIVENELQQILLIYRKGCWDLPKGKIEAGETESEAAKREVSEECGLMNLELKGKITTSYHTYYMPGKNVLKISHWYLMSCSSKEKVKPQAEEDITEIKWYVRSLLDLKKLDTYKSIHQVLSVYLGRKQP
jgi:ADP-ribose pyrophosphatase YjhB (NUDIX family)